MRNLKLVVLILSALFISACSCSKIKYEVTFDIDGKETVVNVNKGDKVETIEEPKKEGYTFDGWYLGEEKYDFNKEVTSDLKLVAKWTKNNVQEEPETPVKTKTYIVKFNTDSESIINDLKVKKNDKVTKPSDPVKNGYKFLGWYLNGKLYNIDKKVTKNITLVAKWEKLPVINYLIEKVEGSTLGQVKLYVTKDNVKVDGSFDLLETDGTLHENVEVKSTGISFNEKLIKEITNVKIK